MGRATSPIRVGMSYTLWSFPVFHNATDHVDLQLAFSRDGLIWTRPERRAVAELGPTGSGEEGQIHVWRNGLVELPDGNWAVPYHARSTLHTVKEQYQEAIFPEMQASQNRWARWRPHRLCGVEAATEGRFTIPTVFRQGNELRLNYRCAPGGWIPRRIDAEDTDYAVPQMLTPLKVLLLICAIPLTGDQEDRVVTWQGSSDITGVGEMVAIRVKMFQAKLFAYKV